MSHVDDGTLHAYLDGELTAVERERADAHLAGCEACRARLAEEGALIERASLILSHALPAVASPPPLGALRRRRAAWRPPLPLLWAATVLLALGIGWYAHDLGTRPRRMTLSPSQRPVADRPAPASAPQTRAPAPVPAPAPASPSEARGTSDHLAAKATTQGVERTRQEIASLPADTTRAADRLAQPTQRLQVRRATEPAAASRSRIALTPPAPAATTEVTRLSTSWPVIGLDPARNALGTEPATIPGFPVRALRRNPADAAQILVEQEIRTGVVVKLYESTAKPTPQGALLVEKGGVRRDTAPVQDRLANERLARFVGTLRIEISGPLPIDSLSTLLDRVRPSRDH